MFGKQNTQEPQNARPAALSDEMIDAYLHGPSWWPGDAAEREAGAPKTWAEVSSDLPGYSERERAQIAARYFDTVAEPLPTAPKRCAYCESLAAEDALECPACGASDFDYECPRCGRVGETPICTPCREELRVKREAFVADALREARAAEKHRKAGSGLGWKAFLTFVMPFVGGYFLIAPFTSAGWRVAGAVWCTVFALFGATEVASSGLAATLVAIVLCLLPVGAFAVRARSSEDAEAAKYAKVYGIWFAAALVISAALCIAGA